MSFGELFVVLVIALVVFGPDKLPMLASHLAKFCKKISAYKSIILQQLVLAEKATNSLSENLEKALAAEKVYKEHDESKPISSSSDEADDKLSLFVNASPDASKEKN